MDTAKPIASVWPTPLCARCGREVGLGVAILRIHTIDNGMIERRICSHCNDDLKIWFYNLKEAKI